MSSVKIKARKLGDPKVQYISLVDRGANRIPFRIIKQQENDMIDISRIFKGSQTEKTTPVQLAALAVEKRDNMDPVVEAIQKAGFETETIVDREDGTVLFQQVEEFDAGKCTIYKVSDQVLALMTGTLVSKSEQRTFVKELFGEYGYIPSMEEACYAVCQSVIKEAGNVTDENFEGFQNLMKSDFEELAGYITDTMQFLPENLLSLELPEAVVKQEVADAPTPDEAKKEDAPAVEEEVPEDTPPKAADSAPDTEAVIAKSLGPLMEKFGDLTTTIKSVSEAVEAVQTSVDEVREQQEQLAAKVEKVDAVAKSAAEAVGGTIVGHEQDGDRAPANTSRIQATKSEEDPYSGTFDTAFLPGAKH